MLGRRLEEADNLVGCIQTLIRQLQSYLSHALDFHRISGIITGSSWCTTFQLHTVGNETAFPRGIGVPDLDPFVLPVKYDHGHIFNN